MTAFLWAGAIVGCSSLPGGAVTPSVGPPAVSPTLAATTPHVSAAPAASPPAITGSPESPVAASPSMGPSTTATAQGTGGPSPTRPSQGPPPPGTLSASGIAAVTGLLGSWCRGDRCLDAGLPAKRALPALTLPAGPGALTFEVPGDGAFVHWSVWYAATTQDRPIVLAQGGSVYDVDAPPQTPYPQFNSATFAAPAGGDWALVVELGFGDVAGGDASYYWRVVVP